MMSLTALEGRTGHLDWNIRVNGSGHSLIGTNTEMGEQCMMLASGSWPHPSLYINKAGLPRSLYKIMIDSLNTLY